jgi:hypothetical protein
MGAIKDLLVAIHNGGDEAVEAAVALAGMEKQKRAYDVVQSAPGSDSIADIVTILRGLSFATNSPDAHESASLLHYCVNYAADEIERLRDERRWIPVSERLPEEGQPVLGCWRFARWTNEMPSMVTSMWYEDGGFFDDNENRERTPTHWMPLPEPPEVK